MFNYKIGLSLVKITDKKLKEREEFIYKTIALFNEKSITSVVNPKYIGIGKKCDKGVIINDSSIILTLYSQQELRTPGKAIRLFSQLLLESKDENNFKDLVSETGKLFKTFNVEETYANRTMKKEVINYTQISDLDFVKALIEYLVENKTSQDSDKKEKSKSIEKMKVIALESGIIKIK